LEFFDAYILSYGFCYLLAPVKRDFYLIKPKFPIALTRFLLLVVGILHVLAVIFNFPFIIFPLAVAETFSCVAHYTGMIEWENLKNSKSTNNNAYLLMAVGDILDAAFLFSKYAITF